MYTDDERAHHHTESDPRGRRHRLRVRTGVADLDHTLPLPARIRVEHRLGGGAVSEEIRHLQPVELGDCGPWP